MDNLTLLVLAAGMGSRYGGLKQLDPMGPSGEILLDYSVHDALQAGFTRVVFVIRRDFEEEFRKKIAVRYEHRMDVALAFQDLRDLPAPFAPPVGREKPWGTGHAILAARETVQTPFLAVNADDFYGRPAYAAIAQALRESGDFAMAGYRLRNTLSENGAVSRGVCSLDKDGLLRDVREFTALVKSGMGAEQTQAEGSRVVFSGDELVSLNFWGFTPAVFPLLSGLFAEFLEQRGQEQKSEFYIPSAVAECVSRGQAKVRVLPTESEWFGVTYREDKPLTQARLAALAAQGLYPTPLWRPA